MTDTTITAELWIRLTEALGLPVEVDPETAVVALEDLVTAPTDAATVAAAAGLSTLSAAEVEALRKGAEQSRVLAAAAARRDITDKVMAAARRGAITTADQKHWIAVLEVDPSKATVLASIRDQFAVPLSEIGHAGEGASGDAGADWLR